MLLLPQKKAKKIRKNCYPNAALEESHSSLARRSWLCEPTGGFDDVWLPLPSASHCCKKPIPAHIVQLSYVALSLAHFMWHADSRRHPSNRAQESIKRKTEAACRIFLQLSSVLGAWLMFQARMPQPFLPQLLLYAVMPAIAANIFFLCILKRFFSFSF